MAISKAVRVSKHCWKFAQGFLSSSSPPFQRLVLQKQQQEDEERPSRGTKRQRRDETRLMEACLVLVQAHHFFHGLWKWGQLFQVREELPS